MTIQGYQTSGSGQAPLFPFALTSPRDPTTTDIVAPSGAPYTVGQLWKNSTSGSVFEYLGNGTWVEISSGASGPITSLTADSGVATPVAGNVNVLGGTGCNTVASGDTLTINVTGFGQEYTVVTANTPMAVNQGYITNKGGSAAVMTLPATSSVGAAISIIGMGATGWSIAQNAGQSIHMNSVTTTVGVGGSLASSAQYNAVEIICTVANTEWTVVSSEGTLTVT